MGPNSKSILRIPIEGIWGNFGVLGDLLSEIAWGPTEYQIWDKIKGLKGSLEDTPPIKWEKVEIYGSGPTWGLIEYRLVGYNGMAAFGSESFLIDLGPSPYASLIEKANPLI
jgi:hypothetical protein